MAEQQAIPRELPPNRILIVAALAQTTERSVRHYLAGKPLRASVADRIAAVLSDTYKP